MHTSALPNKATLGSVADTDNLGNLGAVSLLYINMM